MNVCASDVNSLVGVTAGVSQGYDRSAFLRLGWSEVVGRGGTEPPTFPFQCQGRQFANVHTRPPTLGRTARVRSRTAANGDE
jgi:hypothetical protein